MFRRDDPNPAPWTEEGKESIEANGYTCIYPDNYQEAQAAKKRKKAGGGGDEGDNSAPSTPEATAAKKQKVSKFSIPRNVADLIKTDKVNVKLWQEIREKPMTTKLEFTNLVEEFFNCPICQCIITDPVSTVCSHNLCYDCLKRLIRSDVPDCPSCRTKLKGEENKRNVELKKTLQAIFPGKYCFESC